MTTKSKTDKSQDDRLAEVEETLKRVVDALRHADPVLAAQLLAETKAE